MRKIPDDRSTSDAWRELLDVGGEGEPDSALLSAYADVIRLPHEIREGVTAAAPDKADRVLKHLPSIERAFRGVLHGNWKGVRANLTDAAVHGLEWADDVLSAASRENSLNPEAVADLRGKVRSLIDDIASADDLDDDLRLFLLDHLERVEEALLRARVLGPEAIRRAVEGAAGGWLMRTTEGKSTTGDHAKRAAAFLASVLLVLNIVSKGVELTDRLFPELLPPTDVIDVDPLDDPPAFEDDPDDQPDP